MPKYYCDYCDIFLTHDTAAVRKAHNRGWKHIVQVEQYYSELKPEAYQDIVDTVLRPRGEAKEGDTFTPSFTPYGSAPPAPYGRDSGNGYSPYQGSQRQNHYDDRNGRGNDRNGGDRRPYGRDSRAPIRGDRRPYGNDSRPPPNDGDRR
ncbi:U1 small nuclear ribonucleoprotein C, partial [Tieghemiomyces parasiticus]